MKREWLSFVELGGEQSGGIKHVEDGDVALEEHLLGRLARLI